MTPLTPKQRHLLQSIADQKGRLLATSASGQHTSLKLLLNSGCIEYTNHPSILNASRSRPALALKITDRGRARLAEVRGDSRLGELIGSKP